MPGKQYLAHQRAGVKFLTERPATLLGDEMGLGKTIQGLGAINKMGWDDAQNVLVVAPAFLRLNWQREARAWLTDPLPVHFDTPGRDCGVVITNYERLHRTPELYSRVWDVVILDESHYIKNPDSLRTRSARMLKARRRVAMSGTPTDNRAFDLWAVLDWLDPGAWGTLEQFSARYCAPRFDGWAWRYDGLSNADELREKMRSTVLLRRLKAQVLKDLPPKRREAALIPADSPQLRLYLKVMGDLLGKDGQRALSGLLADAERAPYEHVMRRLGKLEDKLPKQKMSEAKRVLGELKAPAIAAYARHVLESSGPGQKVAVFCHHQSVVETVFDALKAYGAVYVHGGVADPRVRQEAIDRFQGDPACRVFVGSAGACGVGVTLTATDIGIIGELDWRVMDQIEDRVHRIGQSRPVVITYLAVEKSMDAVMAASTARKAGNLVKMLDG